MKCGSGTTTPRSELDLGYGAKSTKIEYLSADDQWTTLGDFEFAQGIAEDGYAHNTTVPFNGVAAKSVRITINETWGSVTQTGLSEVRFFYIPVWAKEPEARHRQHRNRSDDTDARAGVPDVTRSRTMCT